jgi:hypothetical protein
MNEMNRIVCARASERLSLRAKRSNPLKVQAHSGDCHVASLLARTIIHLIAEWLIRMLFVQVAGRDAGLHRKSETDILIP